MKKFGSKYSKKMSEVPIELFEQMARRPGTKLIPVRIQGAKNKRVVVRKRRPTTTTLAKRVKRIEYKEPLNYLDTYINTSSATNTWVVTNLLPTSHGDGTGQYEGDQIHVTSSRARMRLTSSNNLEGTTMLRIIVFWDHSCNEGTPSIDAGDDKSLLDTGIITDTILSPYNHHTIDRFKVIYDKVILIAPNSSSDVTFTLVIPEIAFRKYKRKTSRTVTFGTVGSTPVTNGLFAAYYSNQPGGTAPSFQFAHRVFYHP